MERNLFQRVEVAFPILDTRLKKRVYEETIALPWKEKTQAWDMQPDGEYIGTTESGRKKLRHPQQRLIKIHRA